MITIRHGFLDRNRLSIYKGGAMTTSPVTVPGQTINEQASGQVSYIFSKIGLLILLAGFLLSVWFNQHIIAIIFGVMFAITGITVVWSRLAIRRLTCRRSLNTTRVFPGETIDITLSIINQKPLPLPWVDIDEDIPFKLASGLPLAESENLGCGRHNHSCSMLWYSETSWDYQLKGTMRGYYTLHPARLTTGDIFGLYPRSVTAAPATSVIVYPKMYPILQFSIPSLYPVGDVRYERRIFEDPTRIMGNRDYTPHDSPRRIHWKSSARLSQLMVKVFEPTTTLETALFVSVDGFPYTAEDDDATFELGISTAASISRYLIEQGSQTGLYINTCTADTGDTVRIKGGSSDSQLISILDGLARTTHKPSGNFIDFFQTERRMMSWGTTMLIILSSYNDDLLALLRHLKENGSRLVVIQVGNNNAKPSVPLHWINVTNPGDLVNLIAGDTP